MNRPERREPGTLTRSRTDRWLLGVCGGFARHFRAPAWLVRLLWTVSVPVTVGLSAIVYLLLALLLRVSDEPQREPQQPQQ